jgi:hypothetical protein
VDFPDFLAGTASGCLDNYSGWFLFQASFPTQMVLSHTEECVIVFIAVNNNVIIQAEF